jgi:predicted NBD/HSP70 family sugar kinase
LDKERLVHQPTPVTLRDQTLGLLASGAATSRSDLVEALRVSPSTITAVVRRLIEDGVLLEEGVGQSTGGRRPRILRLKDTDGVLAVAELGGKHARVGLCTPGGVLRGIEEVPIDIAAGPSAIFSAVSETFTRLQATAAPGQPVLGVGVALPGPVEFPTGRVVGPARMPGWSGIDPADYLSRSFGGSEIPVLVDNDAKAAAIGEYVTRGHESGDMIYVKAGTGIGACLVSDGQIFRGGRGLSGDVTHVRVADSGERQCSCGSRGCLETVASGAAVARRLASPGMSLGDIMVAVGDGDPAAVTGVRQAGRLLGVALSGLVNFLNPNSVVIGGALSSLDVYVAATRGMLYERCLPSMTQSLTIEASVAGPDAALVGLGHLLRTHASAS